MCYRSSLRWFDKESSVRKTHHIPFVSKSGKFSASTLYFWKAYPEQVLFSLISTVYSRLLRISFKRKIRLDRRHRNDLIKVSIVYVLMKDDWIIDRFLGICKNSTKAAGNFAHFCVYHLDEDKRFVYSQAWRHANWLKFQVFGPSDKSSTKVLNGCHLLSLAEVISFDAPNQLPTWEPTLVDFWVSSRVLDFNDDSQRSSQEWESISDTSSYLSELHDSQANNSEWDSD